MWSEAQGVYDALQEEAVNLNNIIKRELKVTDKLKGMIQEWITHGNLSKHSII